MKLVDSIAETIGDGTSCKKLSPEELTDLGYILSGEKIIMGKRDKNHPALIIHKLLDDSKVNRNLDFCYLYSIKSSVGVILSKPFEHFLTITEQLEEADRLH